METVCIVAWLRGYSWGLSEKGDTIAAGFIKLAADRLEELEAKGE